MFVGNISKNFQVEVYPTNFLVDNKGIIRERYFVITDSLTYNDLQSHIESLLK